MGALEQEVFRVAERLLKDFPNEAAPLLLMANVHAVFGNTTEAKEYCRRSLERDPRRAEAYNSLGVVALLEGSFETAADMWRKALQINPRIAGVHEPLARALLNLGKTDEAVEVLQEGIKTSPESSDSHFLLGQAYLQLKAYEKAKQAYEKAIEIRHDYTLAYYGLATVCARLGERDRAKEYGKKFRELKRTDVDVLREERRDPGNDLDAVRRQVVRTFIEAGGMYRAAGFLWSAEKLWLRAAVLDQANVSCRLKLAALYQQTRREQDTIRVYQQLAKIDPQEAKYPMYLGMMLARMEKLDAAEQAFEQVVQLAPERSWGHQGLAQVYLRSDDKLAEAKTHAQTAVRLEPVASNYYILSRACEKTGDAAGALAALERTVELEPGNRKYRQEYELLKPSN